MQNGPLWRDTPRPAPDAMERPAVSWSAPRPSDSGWSLNGHETNGDDPSGRDTNRDDTNGRDTSGRDTSGRDTTAPSGVRPYLVTAGRVRPRDETLEVECQVLATPVGLIAYPTLTYEPRAVLAACAEPLSVAELAAGLKMHLGVVRILVDDLAAQGYLTVVRPEYGQQTDTDLIRRVIRGLKAIN